MIAVLKQNTTDEQLNSFTSWLKGQGLDVHISKGEFQTVIGLIGDTRKLDADLIASLEMVESVSRVSDPFKSANRKFHPDDCVIDCSGIKVGGGSFAVIAGPCSVESEEQLTGIAGDVKAGGCDMLRGGAFKPKPPPMFFGD